MDFINKAFAQLSELFRSMTIGARITAGLLLTVVVVSLVWLFRYQASSPDLDLMNGTPLSAGDITAMEAAFAAANLNSYEVVGNRIRVPRGQKSRYMAAAADKKAIPNGFFRYLDEAVNGQSNFLETRDQRDGRIQVAKQKELSEIIGCMSGIESARVLWDSETKSGLNPQTTKTALVKVKPIGSAELDESQAANIRRLVKAAIAGMKYEGVTVLDENSGRTFYGDAEGGTSPMDDPYYATKRLYEKQWTGTILSALSYVPGVTVAVNVELEKELRRRETEHKPDQKAVPIRKKENTRTRTREGSAPGGRAGFQANQPQALASSSSKGSHEEEEETTSSEENYLGTTSVDKEIPGLTPTLVKASIQVPTSYFARVWRERNPPQAGEQPKTPAAADLEQIRTHEIAKIKSAVVGLLPQPEKTADPTQFVTVTEFQDITQEPAPLPGLPVQTLDWLTRNWSTLGLILLGGFSLVVLRSIARSAPAPSPRSSSTPFSLDLSALPQYAPEPQEAVAAAGASGGMATERRLRRAGGGGPSLRDELSEMVAEDPEAAAAVLRSWIGNVR